MRALLIAANLPVEGVAEALANGVVAEMPTDDGTHPPGAAPVAVVGAAAVETYGPAGLLRSVVVDPALRGSGVGHAVVAAAEARAANLGIRDLYLLTETAAGWFERLGYEPLDRPAAPAAVAGSWEFQVACPDTAVLMRRRLARS